MPPSSGQPAQSQPDTHVVVFDINVYLDVARLLGPPYTQQKFDEAAAACAGNPLPNVQDQRVDSLRAIAVSRSGNFAGPEPLEVWTSDHIDDLVLHKALQPDDSSLTDEQRGLGWAEDDALTIYADLIVPLVYERTSGDSLGEVHLADGNPPLSNEDGRVFWTARNAGAHHAIRYCVTQDRHFRRCAPELPGSVTVLRPHEWVELVRRSRHGFATSRMRPGQGGRPRP